MSNNLKWNIVHWGMECSSMAVKILMNLVKMEWKTQGNHVVYFAKDSMMFIWGDNMDLSSLWLEMISFTSRLLSLILSPQCWTHFCVISDIVATANLFGPVPLLFAGRGTASLQRSSYSNPYMKTYVVMKALLIHCGTHSCETLLRRSSTACWGSEWEFH